MAEENRFAGNGDGGTDAQGLVDRLSGLVDRFGGARANLLAGVGALVDAAKTGQHDENLVTSRPYKRVALTDGTARLRPTKQGNRRLNKAIHRIAITQIHH
jgi:hypothetical protein